MPPRTWPMTALLVFTGVNFILLSTITPVYDFVCFLPYWERGEKGIVRRVKLPWLINQNRPKEMPKANFFDCVFLN